MAALGRMVIAAISAIHLMVGCCGHHTHACDGHEQSAPCDGCAAAEGQCSDHSDDHANHSHHGPQDCQGSKCSVVLARRTIGDELEQPSQALVVPLLGDLSSAVGVVFEQDVSDADRPLPPVRLHLVHQVLLI